MTLRRTPLHRTTPLARAPWRRTPTVPAIPAADAPFPFRRHPKSRRPTGPNKPTRQLVLDRAGYRCEICGRLLHDGTMWTQAYSVHHRRPRGMGGTTDPSANTPANLMLLCGTGTTGCHGYLESRRALARHGGWLLTQQQDPTTVPVIVHTRGRTLLTVDGRYEAPS